MDPSKRPRLTDTEGIEMPPQMTMYQCRVCMKYSEETYRYEGKYMCKDCRPPSEWEHQGNGIYYSVTPDKMAKTSLETFCKESANSLDAIYHSLRFGRLNKGLHKSMKDYYNSRDPESIYAFRLSRAIQMAMGEFSDSSITNLNRFPYIREHIYELTRNEWVKNLSLSEISMLVYGVNSRTESEHPDVTRYTLRSKFIIEPTTINACVLNNQDWPSQFFWTQNGGNVDALGVCPDELVIPTVTSKTPLRHLEDIQALVDQYPDEKKISESLVKAAIDYGTARWDADEAKDFNVRLNLRFKMSVSLDGIVRPIKPSIVLPFFEYTQSLFMNEVRMSTKPLNPLPKRITNKSQYMDIVRDWTIWHRVTTENTARALSGISDRVNKDDYALLFVVDHDI